MNITKKQLLTAVMEELNDIKRYAFKKEIAKLDIKTFDYGNEDHCIYGQMTGNCHSKRATKLVNKCCNGYVCTYITPLFKEQITFRESKVSIIKRSGDLLRETFTGSSRFSALELYITLKGAKNKEIFEYLKGERKTLKL